MKRYWLEYSGLWIYPDEEFKFEIEGGMEWEGEVKSELHIFPQTHYMSKLLRVYTIGMIPGNFLV